MAWLFAVAIIVIFQSFIDLEVIIPLPFKTLNIPLSDAAACILFPAVTLKAPKSIMKPEIRGFAATALALLLGTTFALKPSLSLYTWLRKPVFMMLCYGGALVWTIQNRVSEKSMVRLLLSWQTLVAGLLFANGVGRVLADETLWWQAIEGITPNHKTLAVSLCGILPLFWAFSDRFQKYIPHRHGSRIFWSIQCLTLAAIAISFSKTAWLIVAFSVGWFVPKNRPISQRPFLIGLLGVSALWLMIQLPFILESNAMIDALRSRHSLNLRAWEMFSAHPFTGMGTGTNLHYELVTFPHYRINGIDAHGSIQKLASEGGVFALLGLGIFFLDGRRHLLNRNPKLLGAYWSLFLCTVLSTELLHSTWWIPYAILMGWHTSNAETQSSTSSTGQ